MDSPSQKLMMLLALSLVVILSATSAGAVSRLIRELCIRSEDYHGCVAALERDPRTADATTALSLGEVALRAGERNSTWSRIKYLQGIYDDPKTRSSWKPVLEVCRTKFINAAQRFLEASRDLLTDKKAANLHVLLASQEIYDCLGFMRSQKQYIPPLVTRCNHVRIHVAIGLAVTQMY